jgi:CRISPR system Cascade subunit CasA
VFVWNVTPEQVDIIRTGWIPTDIGDVTPVGALRCARRTQWNRGDWDGATLLLLHALLQTAVCLQPSRCPDSFTWRRLVSLPPGDLDDWIDLPFGEHPWESSTADGEMTVASLVYGCPGDATVEVKASDIAVWSQNVPGVLTLAQATITLIADNLLGTRIGRGYLSGVRGEQPLTTMVEPDDDSATLWHRVWLNVLPADLWEQRMRGTSEGFTFPWTKELSDNPITPSNAHSLAVLWQMPRRWRLIVDDDGRVRRVHRESYGHQYEGWEHPLTPYRDTANGRFAAKSRAHLGYRDWAGIALNARKDLKPATVVNEYIEKHWSGEALRLRCFGWLLDAAGAPGAWTEVVVPFYDRADPTSIEAALDQVATKEKALRLALKGVRRGLERHADRIYADTESAFFARVTSSAWMDWPDVLKVAARRLFWSVMDEHRIDLFDATRAAGRI